MTATIGDARRAGGQLSATEGRPWDSICDSYAIPATKKDSEDFSGLYAGAGQVTGYAA